MSSHDQHEYGLQNGYAPIAHKVVCVDFDATLSLWGHLFSPDTPPIDGAVEAVKAMKQAGFRIAIFTSRMSPRWLADAGQEMSEQYEYIWKYLTRWGIPFDEITGEKIPAQAYIDDKAIEFTGDNWSAIKERVLAL